MHICNEGVVSGRENISFRNNTKKGKNMASGNIYDDVHRTLVNDQPKLMLYVINEAHGEKYTGEEKIVQGNNEHYFKKQDNSMTKRMLEYDVQIALEQSRIVDSELELQMPKSAVIYLRSTKNTPDALYAIIQTAKGILTYEIPILKIQNYDIEEIFEKKLLFFIPFHIFVYEEEFKEYNNTKEKVIWLQKRYAYLCDRLRELVAEGEIDEYAKHSLMEMTMKIVNHIAAKYENIRKGISEVMGGKVLDYEAKDIWNAGRSEGILQGARDMCISMMKDGIISLAEAAKRLGMSEEELRKRM